MKRFGARGVAAVVLLSLASSLQAQTLDGKPYDDKIMRLAEVLGAIHYLRELCGASEGALWRDRMRDLIEAEGTSALRRSRLTRSFNQGYRSYSRTYNVCSQSAQTAVNRFLVEGTDLSEKLLKSVP